MRFRGTVARRSGRMPAGLPAGRRRSYAQLPLSRPQWLGPWCRRRWNCPEVVHEHVVRCGFGGGLRVRGARPPSTRGRLSPGGRHFWHSPSQRDGCSTGSCRAEEASENRLLVQRPVSPTTETLAADVRQWSGRPSAAPGGRCLWPASRGGTDVANLGFLATPCFESLVKSIKIQGMKRGCRDCLRGLGETAAPRTAASSSGYGTAERRLSDNPAFDSL